MAKQLNRQVNLNISADTKQAQRELNNLFRSLDDIASGKTFSLGNMTKEMTEASQAASALKIHLQNAVNVDTGKIDFAKLDAGFKRSGVTLEEYVSRLVKMGPAGQQAVTQVASALSRSEIPLRRTNKLVTELWTTLKNTAKWQISSSVLHAFMGALQTAKGYAQDLNESLNKIRIVTGNSVEDMAKFAEEANKAARALSTTTTKYTDASLIFYQQGLSAEEVQKRTDVTIKMANAAGQSAEVVSDQLTAIWNNFDNGTKSLEYYADVITALGAATATSTSEIAGGLEKFAAIGETIGLSYEYATAALATITSKTRQSEDVVGTALKTIFARIQGLNLGETAEDGTTLNKYSQALAKVGISIYDTTGELKAMDNILDEMAAKWNTLGAAQQAALAQTVAGVRQYNQLISLMEGWNDGASDSMVANLKTAREASGTLDKQAQIYAESWEAARDRVKAATESIYSTLLDEDFFIGALNVFEEFLTGVDSAIDGLGGLKGVLLTLGAIATQVFNQQIAQGLRDVSYSLMTSAGFTIPNLTEKRAKQQDFVRSQLLNIPGDEESHVGRAYDDQLKAEEELRQAMEKRTDLSEEEKQYFEEQLDLRKKITDEIVLQAQKLTEAENKRAENKQMAKGTVLSLSGGQSDIMAEYESQNKILQSSTEAITKLEERFKLSGDSAKSFEKNLQDITNAIMQLGDKAEVSFTPEDIKKYFDNCDKKSEEASQAIEEFIQKLYALQAAAQRGLTEELSIDETVIERQIEGTKEAVIQQERLNRAKESGAKADEAFLKSLNDAKGQTLDLADGIVDSATAIMSFGQAAFAAKGAIDALNNTELSFGEKASRVFTSLISLSASALSGLRSLSRVQEAYNKLKNKENGQDLKSILTKTLQTKAIELNTKAKRKNNKATTDGIKAGNADIASDSAETMQKNADTLAEAAKNYGKEILPYLGKAALIIAAIATVVATIGISIAVYKKAEKEAERADKHAKKLAESYQELKEKQEAFNSTISSYKEGIEGLEGLTKGTVEYSQALVEANEKAMELIKNNKELSYTIEDGLIKIDENSLEAAQKEQLEAVARGQSLATLAKVNAEIKQLEADITKFNRNLRDNRDLLRAFLSSNATAAAGGGAGAAIGTAIVPGYGSAIGAGIGAAVGGTAGLVGYSIAGIETENEKAILEEIFKAYAQDENKGIFVNETAFRDFLSQNKKLNNELIKNNDALRNNLIKNMDALRELAQRNNEIKFKEEIEEFKLAFAQWNSTNEAYITSNNTAAQANLAVQDYIKENGFKDQAENQVAAMSKSSLLKEYEELYLKDLGIRFAGNLNKNKIKAERFNEDTQQWEKLDYKYNIEDIISSLTDYYALQFSSSLEAFTARERNITNYFDILKSAGNFNTKDTEIKSFLDSIVTDFTEDKIISLQGKNHEDVMALFEAIENVTNTELEKALLSAKESYELDIAELFSNNNQAFKEWYGTLTEDQKHLLWTVIDVNKETSLENVAQALNEAQALADANNITLTFSAASNALKAFQSQDYEQFFTELETLGYTEQQFYEFAIGKTTAQIEEWIKGLTPSTNMVGNAIEGLQNENNNIIIPDPKNTNISDFVPNLTNLILGNEKGEGLFDFTPFMGRKNFKLNIKDFFSKYFIKDIPLYEETFEVPESSPALEGNSLPDLTGLPSEAALRLRSQFITDEAEKQATEQEKINENNLNNLKAQYDLYRVLEENYNSTTIETAEELEKYWISLDENVEEFLQPELQGKLIEFASGYDELTSQVEAYKQAITDDDIISQNLIEKTLFNQIGLLDRLKEEGFDLDLYEAYASKIEELNGPLAYQTDVLQELTIAQMKMQRGLKSLASNWENWNEIVEDAETNWQDYTDILPEVNETLADLLDIDVKEFENLSPKFVTKYWKEITDVFNDVEGATENLRVAMAKEIVLGLSIPKEGVKTNIVNLINELALELPNLEIGATLNDSIYEALNSLLEAGIVTVEQMNSILEGIGFTPEIEYKRVSMKEARDLGYTTVITDKETGTTSTVTSLAHLGSDADVWIPTINSAKTTYKGPPNTASINKSSSGGGGGSSKPAQKPKKSDTVERYKEVNDKLDNVSENLTKIDETTERIYGKSRLTNMEKANELLAKEVELNKEKLKEAKDYLKVDQEALKAAAEAAGISFQFNAAGDISNYTQEMTKLFNEYDNLVNAVNADGNVSDAEQEKLDKIQERIDAVKDALSQYDETKELIADLEKDIIDGTNKIQDQNFKILEEGLSLEVDFNEEQLKLIDHYIKLIEDDIYKFSEAAALSASKYAEYEQNLGSAEEMLSGLTAAYENGKISQSDYVEGLQLFRDTAYENIESIVELKKQMEEYYGNTLDKAIEKLSKYTNQMEQSNSVLEHYYNILTLTNAIPNYGAMDTLLKSQKETAKMQLTAARETAAMLKGQAEERRAAWEAATGLEKEALYEQYQKALEASNTAQEEYLNLAEQYAESIKSVYENAMSELAANLEDVLTGGTSMDQLATAMDRMVSLQEEYLTTTNKIYETNKLMRVAQQAIDKSSNSITKNRLKNFINETQALQDQSQLSEYELEIQKAKYDLLLAEIALQDAQNAKSIVRLQRDSEGNFGYVYTADAEAVGSAADDVAAAQNDLYNIGLRGANDYTQKYQQTMQEMYDSVTELNQQYLDGAFGSYEEFQEQVEATTQYYYDKLKQYQSLYGVAIEVDSRVSADAWGANFETMTNNTEDWYKAVKDYTTEATSALSGYTEEMQELSKEVGLSTKEIAEKTQETAENNKELLNVLTGENGLIKAFDDEATAVANITDAFLTQANAIEDLIVKYDDLIERTLTLQGIEKDQDLKIEETKTQENTSEPVVKNAEATAAASSNATTWERGLEAFNKINRGAWGSGLSNRIQKGVADGFTEAEVRLGQSIIEKYYSGYTDFDKIKALLGFESGGYTGNWAGSSGRLALLHKKELVLNKDDTQNFLSSISLLDKILSAIDLYSANAQFTGGLRAASAASHNQSLEQHITIEASFPAVQSHFEIEEAFNNLAIQASQYANQK